MADATQVLVIEDDTSICLALCDGLQALGFHADACDDGAEGEARAMQGNYDLVLLDMALPSKDGMAILASLREARPRLPIIVLTARGDLSQRVAGLRSGADDYIVKPFSFEELSARIEAVLRRSAERPSDMHYIDFADGRIDLNRLEIHFVDQGVTPLIERECDLLRYLASHAGRAISRDELFERVWRIGGHSGNSRSIDMQIARLRQKLRDDGNQPRLLLTVRGQGYMWAQTEAAS